MEVIGNSPSASGTISQDAERYQRDQYSRIVDSIKPLLKRDPQVQTYIVAHSTTPSHQPK